MRNNKIQNDVVKEGVMKKRYSVIIFIMIFIAILLCMPSIVYIIQNGTMQGFDFFHAYTYNMKDGTVTRFLNWVIFTALILSFSTMYILIIKYEKNIFKNKKQIYGFIFLISVLFALCLYYYMSDLNYYIGDSWLCAKYKENPYYTTVEDLKNKGISDEMLNNAGPWKKTTSTYGPVWNIISTVLVSFSFGSYDAAFFIFKIASLIVHILNCYLVYKITKSNKYMLLYGLNPLVLISFLTNVHNDIYLIMFLFLSLYFLLKKKNVFLSLLFLGISVATKYSTVLIVPFILLYIFKEKSIPKKILYSFLCGMAIILMAVLLYMPYYRDISIFTNMLVQTHRYCQSIPALIKETIPSNILSMFNIELILKTIFVSIYMVFIIELLFIKKNITIRDIAKKYNMSMLFFIFFILTNFHEWYLTWLLPTIMWQNKYMRYFVITLTIMSLIYPIGYYLSCSDGYRFGIYYSLQILIFTSIIVIVKFANEFKLLLNKKLIKIKE